MKRTFILLKDLPNIKAGMKFLWDGYNYESEDGADAWKSEVVENTPDWFREFEPQMYSEKDMRKCWEAARDKKEGEPIGRIETNDGDWGYYYNNKHLTFNDYLKTL